MGITGLLKGLEFCSQKRSIRDFSNQTLAVDTSSWLHKSVYSVSERYVESLDTGRLDQTCIQVATKYIVNRCQELLVHADIAHIYLVLDGKRCPLKAQTNQDREERRQKNLADARRYKQAGRPDKALEKYKACIKISSDMANAVADAVTRRFATDPRVQCVYSPYEADAQLVKLCMDRIAHAVVTEDSDVLVYSASCNFSFPILYKLERDTGACDVISMDWLLNPDVQPNWTQPTNKSKQKNGGGALESILKSLVSRQSRRPGVGARLFVQACVLAGCDYCPSQLNGVGLVTAFKLIRDNAHRPAASRFEKALKSLSKKARANITIVEYEDLLSKSEAVFYYHPVLDMDSKHVIPLMTLRTTEEANEAELQTSIDSHPSVLRYEEDLSFLGSMAIAGLKAHDDDEVHVAPIAEIFIPQKSHSQKPKTAPYDGGADAVAAVMRNVAVENPYAKTKKRKRNNGTTSREPLTNIDTTANGHSQQQQTTSGTNLFTHFAHKTTAVASSQPSGRSMYVQNRQDVRFVKRNFRAKPKPYAKMLSEGGSLQQQGGQRQSHSRGGMSRSSSQRASSRGSSHRHESRQRRHSGHSRSSRSHVSSRGLESDHIVQNVEASVLASSFQSEGPRQDDDQHFQVPPAQYHTGNNIFEEENSFCYSEIDPHSPAVEIETHSDSTNEPFSRLQASQPRVYDESVPFGNPDLADDADEKASFYSTDLQSARRVTLDDADKDKALYTEFDAAAKGTQLDQTYGDDEDIEEYHSQARHPSNEAPPRPSYYHDDAGTSSKYFSTSKRPPQRTRPENEFNAPHINGGSDSFCEDPQDTIDESAVVNVPSFSRPARPSMSRQADEWSIGSSCEDIASPENQGKARTHFGDHGWAVMVDPHVQTEVQVAGSRPSVKLETFVTGATPPVQPSSPLSITSPPRATLNIQSFPAQRRRTTKSTKRGTITDFFSPRI